MVRRVVVIIWTLLLDDCFVFTAQIFYKHQNDGYDYDDDDEIFSKTNNFLIVRRRNKKLPNSFPSDVMRDVDEQREQSEDESGWIDDKFLKDFDGSRRHSDRCRIPSSDSTLK